MNLTILTTLHDLFCGKNLLITILIRNLSGTSYQPLTRFGFCGTYLSFAPSRIFTILTLNSLTIDTTPQLSESRISVRSIHIHEILHTAFITNYKFHRKNFIAEVKYNTTNSTIIFFNMLFRICFNKTNLSNQHIHLESITLIFRTQFSYKANKTAFITLCRNSTTIIGDKII